MTILNPLPDAWRDPEGMHPLLAGILTTTHARHVDMIQLVRDLPDDALMWRLGPQMSSLAGLVLHMMDDETEFVRSLAGMPNGWPGTNGEYLDAIGSADALVSLIRVGDGLLKQVYTALDEPLLRERHPATGAPNGEELIELADHHAMHYGQMQITRHLYEQSHPEFATQYQHWR
jgi:hypothetical protein